MAAGPSPVERLRRSGITPDRGFGQNFLIDPNILGVIEKMAALGRDDIVLEVGPGLGVLTGRLLERCGLVHCVEVDKRLADLLKEEFGSNPRFRLHTGDAVRMDLGGLAPPPDKFVSNLPYNVATALVMKSLAELPTVRSWCLMLQREIAERLFARPGTAAYGSVSVMTQLLTVREASRPVPAAVFYPRPRVRSALLAFRRRQRAGFAGDHFGEVRALVRAAFSHRRKLLVNSLAGAGETWLPPGVAGPGGASGGGGGGTGEGGEAVKKQVIGEALARAGLKADVRPQQVTPLQYEKLAVAFSEGRA